VIVLDTNVLSELMRSAPDAAVTKWVTSQAATSLFITTITQAEILHGILLLPRGRRRDAIKSAASSMFEEDFAGRIFPFSSLAAHAYAEIVVARRQSGRPISQFDAQIASIAKSAGAGVATRNVADFEGCGIKVIDPWQH
jgi:predicted nucleic acid-binding protein